MKLAAGETVCEDFDLPAEGNDHTAGIKLYDKAIYADGSCEFDSFFSFDYQKEKDSNSPSCRVPLSLEVVFVSPETSAYSK